MIGTNIFKGLLEPARLVLKEYYQCSGHPVEKGLTAVRLAAKKDSGWLDAGFKNKVGLIEAISSYIDKEIKVVEADGELMKSMGGFVMEYENHALIFVNRNRNFCSRRMYVAKELSHLLLNTFFDGLRLVKYEDVLHLIQNEVVFGAPRNNSEASERAAYAVAFELLFPKEYVERVTKNDQTCNSLSIAQAIKCPKDVVEYRLSDSTRTLYDRFYNEVNEENLILRARMAKSQKLKKD